MQDESGAPARAPMRLQFAYMGDAPPINLVKLREILLERAVSDDLRVFCADLRVNYEEVVGPNDKLPIAIINIIKYFDSRGRIDELTARARREFLGAEWADVQAAQTTQTAQAKTADSITLTETAQVTIVPAPRQSGPLRVFLCHASDDKPAVRELYQKLQAANVQPWLDEEELLPGQKWKVEIPKAIRASDVILVCLSQSSVKKDGYVKREIEFALDIADKLPEDAIFIIPLRLEECDFPERLGDWHGVNLYAPRGYERLMRALQVRANKVGIEPITPLREAEQAPHKPSTTDPLLIELPKLSFHLEMVRVPAGEFLMGSDKTKDPLADDKEFPQHQVYLDDYYIGKYPIAVAQFAAFVKATSFRTSAEKLGKAFVTTEETQGGIRNMPATKGANWRHPRGLRSGVRLKQDHPVTCVSWDDAIEFCKWLSQMTGQIIQLPTEAQWEKAARGPLTGMDDGHIWPWGNESPDATRCNFHLGNTSPVGQYSPHGDSPYGCADMAGNVWEWCADWFDETEYERHERDAQAQIIRNPKGPSWRTRLLSARVLRGGAFHTSEWFVRCAHRFRAHPGDGSDDIGFRVCAFPI